MNKNIITTILFTLFGIGIFYLLSLPIELKHEFHGLKHISQQEIENKITSLNLKGKSLLQINPRKISKLLEASPLIKEAKIKVRLFPQAKLSIYIKETKPWAIYRNQILGNQAQVLIQDKTEAIKYQSEAINKLYDDFYQHHSELVELISARDLNKRELHQLKETQDFINYNLDLIASNNINSSQPLEHIRMIRINRINNVFFYSNKLKFIAGILDTNMLERVKRLKTVVPQIIELSRNKELAYVDLSLDTDEVLLGKVQEL